MPAKRRCAGNLKFGEAEVENGRKWICGQVKTHVNCIKNCQFDGLLSNQPKFQLRLCHGSQIFCWVARGAPRFLLLPTMKLNGRALTLTWLDKICWARLGDPEMPGTQWFWGKACLPAYCCSSTLWTDSWWSLIMMQLGLKVASLFFCYTNGLPQFFLICDSRSMQRA